MKKLLTSVLALALFGFTLNAQVYSTNVAAGTHNLLATGGKQITSLTVIAGGTNTILRLYDVADTTLTQVVAAHTNVVRYSTNIVSTWVTTTGLTNNMTNTYIYTDSYPVGAATNAISPVLMYAVPASTIATFTDRMILTKGLSISNDQGNTTYILNYSSN